MKQAFFILLSVTSLILVYKTAHYWRHFASKRLDCWLYFGRSEIMLSSTTNRRVAKEQQNILSMLGLVGLILSGCMYFLMY